MKIHRNLPWASFGAAVLGIALCVPPSMLAQASTPPPDTPATTTQSSAPHGMRHHSRNRHGHHRWSAESRLNRLSKELNLTQSQQQQMLPVLQQQNEKMKSLGKEFRQQMQQSMQDTNGKLEALMTATQKQKFEQMKQQRRAQMQQRHHGGGMGMHQGTTAPPQ